jgi:hypothetical protein
VGSFGDGFQARPHFVGDRRSITGTRQADVGDPDFDARKRADNHLGRHAWCLIFQDGTDMTKLLDATRQECSAPTAQPPLARTVLIVEDDEPLRQRLAQAMQARGFRVTTAESVAEGIAQIKLSAPAFAVVDL